MGPRAGISVPVVNGNCFGKVERAECKPWSRSRFWGAVASFWVTDVVLSSDSPSLPPFLLPPVL